MSQQENTPLLGKGGGHGRGTASNGKGSSGTYYFQNSVNKSDSGQYQSVSDADGGQVVESLPPGSTAEDFEPRALGAVTKKEKSSREPGLFGKLFGSSSNKNREVAKAESKPPIKPRKAPIKVEPKVFFANERTFLAWMHISIILAGASIAILAFSEYEDMGRQVYGLIMLPVAIAFIVYSMYQYMRRAYMIRNKLPGPYDDTVGPTVLGIMLMISITAQFALKLMTLTKS